MPILAEPVFDVAVVGGGPAGAAAAHAAAKSGLRAVLLEGCQRNRDKTCGDLLMPPAIAMLEELQLDRTALRALGGCEYRGIDLLGPQGLLWSLPFPATPVWMVPRKALDQALRDTLETQTSVLYGSHVVEVAQAFNGIFQLRCRVAGDPENAVVNCRVVVLAAGAADRMATRIGIGGHPTVAPSISAYVTAPARRLPAFEFGPGSRPGYCWNFPAGNGRSNIGVCALQPATGATIKAIGQAVLHRGGHPEARWRGGAGALWSGKGRLWHDPRGILSCGDAAGLVDPWNGEGISAALRSGKEAGLAAAMYLSHGYDIRWLQRYSEWIRSSFEAAYQASQARKLWKHLSGIS